MVWVAAHLQREIGRYDPTDGHFNGTLRLLEARLAHANLKPAGLQQGEAIVARLIGRGCLCGSSVEAY